VETAEVTSESSTAKRISGESRLSMRAGDDDEHVGDQGE
jgi:hypothetical protein